MAVHERSWRPWQGAETPGWKRLLILPRYAYGDVFKSRIFTGLFAAGFVLPLVALTVVFLRHNLSLFSELKIDPTQLFSIDAAFFLQFLTMQCFLGFVVAVILGPALVSPDLVNGALPVILSRPVTKSGYVAGKFLVLGLLLSAISWIPGLAVWGLEAGYAGAGWASANVRLPLGIVAGALLFLTTISLYSLAVSAWVRSRAVARAVLIGTVFVSSAAGEVLADLAGFRFAKLLVPMEVITAVWAGLLGATSKVPISAGEALVPLAAVWAFSLLMLRKKLRPKEVVR